MDSNNLTFVYTAYGVTWALLVAYTWHVHATLRRARASYDRSTHRTQEEK